MSEKARIVAALGERRLLVPHLLNEALAANERAKYLLALLQTARARADSPAESFSDLHAERMACGIADPRYDDIVAETVASGGDSYAVPYLSQLWPALCDDLQTMLAPFDAMERPEADLFRSRVQQLTAVPCYGEDGTIAGKTIAFLASVDQTRGDSVHLLVMEMHKFLNRLQAEVATDTVEGALTYGVRGNDRSLVAAFMKGVNRTAPLKFDHPGLGTTAAKSGEKLVIQNDIGTTDAHVLVVQVVGNSATVTYTDNHLSRLLFFQGMFADWAVVWGDVHSRTDRGFENGVYHLCTGTYAARDKGDLKAYLAHLGSRLVFLIDWNRARKRLQLLVPREVALSLLSWAAVNDVGHMAFLKAGGERIIFDALQFVGGGAITYGVTLAELLGREAAVSYLRFILKSCMQGIVGKRPPALIRDEARVELYNYFHSAQQGLLDLAGDHAALAVEIAAGIRDGLLTSTSSERFERLGQRAKEWERKADELVIRARELAKQSGHAEAIRQLLEVADDIPDELEEAAFHLTLLPEDGIEEAIRAPLAALARLLVDGTQEYVKAIENARGVHRSGAPDDMRDFLVAVHRIVSIEEQSDTAERGVRKALAGSPMDYRQAFALAECAKKLESAADALMHTGMTLRDQIIGKIMES